MKSTIVSIYRWTFCIIYCDIICTLSWKFNPVWRFYYQVRTYTTVAKNYKKVQVASRTKNRFRNESTTKPSISALYGAIHVICARPALWPKKTFPIEDLATITPDDVMRWMCLKCFGVEHPRLEDLPTLCRSSNLEVYKEALSWYMPNRVACWD
jgi:hypothetical protein